MISGDIRKIVIVKTNPGYGPSPGHVGTGQVVAIVCVGNQSANLWYLLNPGDQLEGLPGFQWLNELVGPAALSSYRRYGL